MAAAQLVHPAGPAIHFHPGANIANPANPASGAAIPNALALGLRTALQF